MAKLACMVMPEGAVDGIVEVAREAERLGYERIWIPDEGLAGRDCYVTLAAIAAATERVGVGTGITNPYTRHPGVTAAAIATLDELAGGRAALGIGAGGGLTLGPLAVERAAPLAAIRDLVTASRSLWSGHTVDLVGATGSFDGARLGYGRPNIPIWLAGRGPKVMALGGELADGFVLSYVHKELLGEHVRIIRTAADEAGRRPPRLAYMTMIAGDDGAVERARAALTFRLVDSPPEVKERLGLGPAETDALRAVIREGGPRGAAHLVRDEWIDQFVIVGSPDECRDELRALMERHQLDEFQVSINDLDLAGDVLAAAAAVGRPTG
jgi:5,10-methylenetetrahydromethanopterin reductase